MKIIQDCEVVFEVYCPPENRKDFYNWANENLNSKSIDFDDTKFIFYDMWEEQGAYYFLGWTKVPCEYIRGWSGNRIEPPESAYIEGVVDTIDFQIWLEDIIPTDFDVEVDIDYEKTKVPREEDLLKEVEDS